jgi:hypothetical protein
MLSCGLNVLLDRSGHSTEEIVCFFIMSGPKPQHPESRVPFPPSSEPCYSAEPFLGYYKISLSLDFGFFSSSLVGKFAIQL